MALDLAEETLAAMLLAKGLQNIEQADDAREALRQMHELATNIASSLGRIRERVEEDAADEIDLIVKRERPASNEHVHPAFRGLCNAISGGR
jgi:hypothetical protein